MDPPLGSCNPVSIPVPRLCYVTAFLDIGRGEWKKKFKRTVEDYFSWFSPLFFSLAGREEIALTVFLDGKYLEKFFLITDPFPSNVTVVPMNEEFLQRNIPLWKRLEKEREIMASESYKKAFSYRLDFPENSNPEYTMINHAKIDFVNLAMSFEKFETVQNFCWVDFGYCQLPENIPKFPLDTTLFRKNKITYTLINPLEKRDENILLTMLMTPERIGGFFFFGNREALKKYQKLYHRIHAWFQKENLADDDQHLALRCFFADPKLFSLPCLGGWHRALQFFQQSPVKVGKKGQLRTETLRDFQNS